MYAHVNYYRTPEVTKFGALQKKNYNPCISFLDIYLCTDVLFQPLMSYKIGHILTVQKSLNDAF